MFGWDGLGISLVVFRVDNLKLREVLFLYIVHLTSGFSEWLLWQNGGEFEMDGNAIGFEVHFQSLQLALHRPGYEVVFDIGRWQCDNCTKRLLSVVV